jgi:hypothetical protein
MRLPMAGAMGIFVLLRILRSFNKGQIAGLQNGGTMNAEANPTREGS